MMKLRSEGKRSKSGRFRLVKRIGARKRVSTESEHKSLEDVSKENVRPERESIDETVSMDVLGERESISSSESDNDGTNELIVEEPKEQALVTMDTQEADLLVSIHTWLHDVDALVHSDEMSAFIGSSVAISTIAVKTALHVAVLPVRLPIHVVSSTTGMLIGTCTHVIGSVCSVSDRSLTVGESTSSSENPVEVLIRNITSAIPFLLRAVDRIKDDIGSTILGVVCPVLTGDSHESRAGESSAEKDNAFLERLRLDIPPHPSKDIQECSSSGEGLSKDIQEFCSSGEILKDSPRSPDVSKFLLRVCDLGISLRSEADCHEKVFHIDLSKEFANKQLTMQALDALVEGGLALLSSCPEARLQNRPSCQDLVDWKPEGQTTKLLRKKPNLTPGDWTAIMSKEVLVWSGKLKDRNLHKADIPVFLSRGIVPVSPRGMLNLFWDDSRTRSYNKFSLGRRTSMEIEEGLAESSTTVRATKVVQSETQVPLTGFSVVMSTLMHARQLDEPEPCYVIVSRSLSPGRAGTHVGSRSSSIHTGKNELLWGVNVLRKVPGNPNLTDLTSVSQVSAAMVAQFLTHRVGIMAVESCFNAMRAS